MERFNESTLTAIFPGAVRYRETLADVAGHCEEQAPAYSPDEENFSERHLQCIWADPRLRPAELRTTAREPVEVVHPGDWNPEAGPDFTGAVLLVGRDRRRMEGDVEIHVRAADWKRHGHDRDPRYRRVRFHVVYYAGPEVEGLLQIPLHDPLVSDPFFSFENVDVTARPIDIPDGLFPLRDVPPEKATRWLEGAGEERLRSKALRLRRRFRAAGAFQVLWEELSAALGYKHNKGPFRRLAALLPVDELRRRAETPEHAYAILLGVSGLLPVNPDPEWDAETRRFLRRLWDVWWRQEAELKEAVFPRASWTLSGVRPANHPVRRLMAAAYYLFRLETLPERPEELIRFPENYWSRRLGWKRRTDRAVALVGPARAAAVVTNVLIPWRAARGERVNLSDLPAEPLNAVIRRTAHALFGPDHSPRLYASALARQGLLQVFHDWVLPRRLEELAPAFVR